MPDPDTHAIRTVIVDDDPSVTYLLSVALDARGGFDVVATCDDPRAALHIVADARPELVVVDLHLGRRDGIWLAERLRTVRRRSTVVALVTGAVIDERIATLASDAGFDVVATKRDLTRSLPDALRAAVRDRRRGLLAAAG